jgi:hypothetical protein
MADPSDGVGALLGRLNWHIDNGLIYVPVYAWVLLRLQRQSRVGTGIIFGVILWLLGPMLSVPMLLNLDPRVIAGELTNPGVFMLKLGHGWAPAFIDLGAHLVHGILVGVICKHRVVSGDD